ncbi:hypothetical protein Godav_000994 [Gossypium davidsonii]|uniref:Uncharacterized protein n=1 Tax=Gossypium davidsonii TaxID=34287 RepID=A0A7J8T1G6_GOSDV|nr:hypothetical protein [Gossypium davidsonii]
MKTDQTDQGPNRKKIKFGYSKKWLFKIL